MNKRVEFFFDIRSPYSYLAFTQLREMTAEIVLRPMNVLAVMGEVGNVPTTITCAAKGRYARMDLFRWTQLYGVTLNPSDVQTTDGDACARAVLAASSPAEGSEVTLALFRACWSEATALTNTADILAVLEAAGINAKGIGERIDAPDVVAQLDANNSEAAKRDVFGAPTMFVGDAMFFGNDRIEFVRNELARLSDG